MSKLPATLSRYFPRCKKSRITALLLLTICGVAAPQIVTNAIENSYAFVSQTGGWKFIKDLNNGNIKAAERQLKGTNDRVAIKLFYWWQYSNGQTNEPFVKIASFINNHPHWPDQKAMERTAELKMPSDYDDAKVVEWFDKHEPQTSVGILRYLKALETVRPNDDLSPKVQKYWQTVSMGTNDQKAFYNRYKSNIAFEDHKKRLDLLLFADKYSEGKSLARIMGNGYPQLAEARVALSAQKGGVDRYIQKVPAKLKKDAGLQYERLKWRRKKNKTEGAIEILSNAPAASEINNPDDWWFERHVIIRRLLEDGEHKRAYLLAKSHRQESGFASVQADWIQGWLGLRYADRPEESFQIFQTMYSKVETPISKGRAAYWAARSAEGMGAEALAKNWDQTASLYAETYYGQLASQNVYGALKVGFSPRKKKKHIVNASLRNPNQYQDLKIAAHYLESAGATRTASEFRNHILWMIVETEGEDHAIKYIEELAKEGHWKEALKSTKYLHRKGMMFDPEVLFPYISYNLQDRDMNLINALVRQESMFDVNAKSPAGARGLMQLMPATAKEVARNANITHKTNWLTTKPEHNVELGANYIHRLLDKYDGNRELAIAAYNAGPGRVDRWLKQFGDPRKGDISMIDWIEHIPVYETRNYVQRVTENYNVYQAINKRT